MKKRINFFAANDDLLPVLELVEHDSSLRYTLAGNHLTESNESFLRAKDIPNLGRATKDASIKCPRYLVNEQREAVATQLFKLDAGGYTYSTSQIGNPDSITVAPAGVWSDDVVLAGSVTTVSDTAGAQRLMKLFDKGLRRTFVKVGVFWVGPSALALLDKGARLTVAIQSPPDLDLHRE